MNAIHVRPSSCFKHLETRKAQMHTRIGDLVVDMELKLPLCMKVCWKASQTVGGKMVSYVPPRKFPPQFSP